MSGIMEQTDMEQTVAIDIERHDERLTAECSLFILLYTSGSTGVPKGCQLEHRNLVCFCHWYQRYYDLKPEHRVAAYASYGFDACMMDLYPALTAGATVFIVDEASMLSDHSNEGQLFGSGSLLEDLVRYVRSGRGCRLILVGDSAQLPPVGADFSPALDEATLARFGEVEYVTLDEVVRQEAESGILFNATLVRCMLERGITEIPHFDCSFPDFTPLTGGEFLEVLQDAYAKYGRDEVIVITRSNKRANRYNEGIRRNALCAEEEIESGDMLMVVKNNYHYTERIEDCPMHFIANGDIAHLRRLRRFEDFYGFRFADAVLEFPDYDDTEIECKILLDTLSSEAPALTKEEQTRLFFEVEKDYMEIKSKLKRFKEIRENPHFNALQIKFANAVTCHKAQGGQWRVVFVDRCLFGDEPMTRDMLRWLYTALTRATDHLYLINFDEEFYG